MFVIKIAECDTKAGNVFLQLLQRKSQIGETVGLRAIEQRRHGAGNDDALTSGQAAVEVVPLFEVDDPVIVEWCRAY